MSFRELKIIRMFGWLRGNTLMTKVQYQDGHTEIKIYALKKINGRRLAKTA